MDFTISEEDRLLRDSIRDFVEEKANAVWPQLERTGEIPQPLIDGMREMGFFGLSIPSEEPNSRRGIPPSSIRKEKFLRCLLRSSRAAIARKC